MSITQERDQKRIDKMLLTDYAPVHTGADHTYKIALGSNQIIQLPDINSFCHNLFI